MMKFKKEKILVSLVVITLITLVFGSIYSLASTPLIADTNTSATDENTTGAVNNQASNTNTNTNTGSSSSTAIVGSTVNTNTNTNSNTNTNTNRNTLANNTVKNTTNSSKLPYAGTNSSVIFVVIALAISALYAYKKISDYNV